MHTQGWKKYALGAGSTLVLAIAILLVSGWGTAAADQLFSVFVTNTAANPVPVREQNLDGSGSIKVHEQGTAHVNVTNTPSVTLDTSGNTVKLDPSNSTVTLDSTDSGKLDTAIARLGNIDTAAGKLNFDGSGNLDVHVASGGTSDPTVATTSPCGFGTLLVQSHNSQDLPCNAGNVTAFSFHTNNDVEITLSNEVNGEPTDLLRMILTGGNSLVQSLAHAMAVNDLSFYCLSGNDCTITYSVIGY
jgi:hypothetical protein